MPDNNDKKLKTDHKQYDQFVLLINTCLITIVTRSHNNGGKFYGFFCPDLSNVDPIFMYSCPIFIFASSRNVKNLPLSK